MSRFILGAIVGGVMMYLWGEQITEYLETNTRELRSKGADTLRQAGARGAGTLKQAGEMMQSASGKLSDRLAVGQEAVRSTFADARSSDRERSRPTRARGGGAP